MLKVSDPPAQAFSTIGGPVSFPPQAVPLIPCIVAFGAGAFELFFEATDTPVGGRELALYSLQRRLGLRQTLLSAAEPLSRASSSRRSWLARLP